MISFLVKTKVVRRRVARRPPPKPAGPIIIDKPVDYQLALQQQQQIILGQRTPKNNSGSNNDNTRDTQVGSDDEAKHLAEFLKPRTSTDKSDSSSQMESRKTETDPGTVASDLKDDKVPQIKSYPENNLYRILENKDIKSILMFFIF